MTSDIIIFIIWILCGVSTIICGIIDERHMVSIVSYFVCWVMLMLHLFEKII